MPTLNPRITFTVSEDMMQRIDEYRFDNRIKNQTQAIVALLNKGLSMHLPEPAPKQVLTREEEHVLEAYRAADVYAKQYALQLLETHPTKKVRT